MANLRALWRKTEKGYAQRYLSSHSLHSRFLEDTPCGGHPRGGGWLQRLWCLPAPRRWRQRRPCRQRAAFYLLGAAVQRSHAEDGSVDLRGCTLLTIHMALTLPAGIEACSAIAPRQAGRRRPRRCLASLPWTMRRSRRGDGALRAARLSSTPASSCTQAHLPSCAWRLYLCGATGTPCGGGPAACALKKGASQKRLLCGFAANEVSSCAKCAAPARAPASLYQHG